MDLSKIKTTERLIQITDPRDGKEIGVQVSLVALTDPRLKGIKRKMLDAKLRLEQRGKGFKAEDVEENMNNVLFTAMTGWSWGKGASGEQADFQGKVPEFNRESVYAVFETLPWFMAQIDEALGDEKAFYQA